MHQLRYNNVIYSSLRVDVFISPSYSLSSSSSGVGGSSVVAAEVDFDGGSSWTLLVGVLSLAVCSDWCGLSWLSRGAVVDDLLIDGRLTLIIFWACSSWLISCCCVSIVWFKCWYWRWPCPWSSVPVPWPPFIGRVDWLGWPMPIEEGVSSDEQYGAGGMPVGHEQPLVAVPLVLVICPMTVVGDDGEGPVAGARWMSVEDKLGPLPVESAGLVAVDKGKQ